MEGGFQEWDLFRIGWGRRSELVDMPPKDSHAELAGLTNSTSFMCGLRFGISWSISDLLAWHSEEVSWEQLCWRYRF